MKEEAVLCIQRAVRRLEAKRHIRALLDNQRKAREQEQQQQQKEGGNKNDEPERPRIMQHVLCIQRAVRRLEAKRHIRALLDNQRKTREQQEEDEEKEGNKKKSPSPDTVTHLDDEPERPRTSQHPERPSTVAQSTEDLSESTGRSGRKKRTKEEARGAARVSAREAKDQRALAATVERIDFLQYYGLETLEERARTEYEEEEEADFEHILRSEKAHKEFVVVDAERIQRAKEPSVRQKDYQGLDLLYESLKIETGDDRETTGIHEDRRQRVVSLLEDKKRSEDLRGDLKLRLDYTQQIKQEAHRLQTERSNEMRELSESHKAKQERNLNKSLDKAIEEREAHRADRVEKVKAEIEFVKEQGNFRAKLHQADKYRKRLMAIERNSSHIRRGFVKHPSSRSGSESRSPSSLRSSMRRGSSSPSSRRSSPASSPSHHRAQKEKAVRVLQGLGRVLAAHHRIAQRKAGEPEEGEEQQQREPSVVVEEAPGEDEKGEARHQPSPSPVLLVSPASEEENQHAHTRTTLRMSVSFLSTDSVERNAELQEKREEECLRLLHRQEERRRQFKEKHAKKVEKRKEEEKRALIHSQKLREEAQERHRQSEAERKSHWNDLEDDKRQMRRSIRTAAEQRRELEVKESSIIHQQLQQRLEFVRSRPNIVDREAKATLHDAKIKKETHAKALAMQKAMDDDERQSIMDHYRNRYTAEASRHQELEALRDQKTATNSRRWQQRYKAKNERQEVAKLQQLMSARNRAMMTRADSLMAEEVVVTTRAVSALEKQQRLGDRRKEALSTEESVHFQRRLLAKMYSRPPDMPAPSSSPAPTKRAQSAMEQTAEERRSGRGETPPIGRSARGKKTGKTTTGPGAVADASSFQVPDISRRRLMTPQPTRVLPVEFLKPKPSLTNPTVNLLRTADVPASLREKAVHLYHLLEEAKTPQRLASSSFLTDVSPTRRDKQPTPVASAEASGIEQSPQRCTSVDDLKLDSPRRVRAASDRLTKKSIAQEAMRMQKEHDNDVFILSTIHDDVPKVTTPSKRLYEPAEDRRARQKKEAKERKQETEEARKAKEKERTATGLTHVDVDFTTRFYGEQVRHHKEARHASSDRVMKRTMVISESPVMDDSGLSELVTRLTRVRHREDAETVSRTSKQFATPTKRSQSPSHVTPVRNRDIAERLYASAQKKQAAVNEHLDSLYLAPLVKPRKISPAQIEECSNRLSGQ